MKLLFVFLLLSISASAAQDLVYELQLSPSCPSVTLYNVPFSCTVEVSWHWPNFTVESPIANLTYEVFDNETLLASGELSALQEDGSLLSVFDIDDLAIDSYGRNPFTFFIHSHLPNNTIYSSSETIIVRTIPGILSLLSPAVMMLIAALTHEVIPALFCGIWVASTFVNYYNPLLGLLRSFDTYIPGSIQDEDNAAILFFVLLLGGMVGVLHDAGAVQSLARVASRWATSSKRGQYAVVLVSVFNFFDDYTNTLITGNSMQALADKVKISRSKLAFIVDTTASPFASLVPVSSWIGFQVGLIAEAFQEIGIKRDPYMTLIVSIPYRFYPIGLVLFLFMNITLMREYGPMWKKEREAREKEPVSLAASRDILPLEDNDDVEKTKESEISAEILNEQNERLGIKAFIAAFSIMGTVLIVIIGLFVQGYMTLVQMRDEGEMVPINARSMISNSNSLQALLWGCGIGTMITLFLVVGFRIMTFKKSLESWNQGTMSVLSAVIVLIFAWGMGKAIEDSRAVDFVINFIGNSLNPKLVPFIVVIISGALAAATGASWGVMVILFPLAVPLAHSLAPGNDDILINTIGGILGGSMLGDHCSPIADTTILAATSSGCSLLDHYKTQLPYVLTVGLITPVFGHLMTGLGLYPPVVGIVINLLFCVGVLLVFGKKIRPVDGDTRSNMQKVWEKIRKRNTEINETTPLTAK